MAKEDYQSKLKRELPDEPGIYLFYDKKGELIYVGKATSLRSRVASYFSGKKTSRPIEQMMHFVERIDFRELDSALEAAIAEANWIKKYEPKYNVVGKDNKSWNFIVVTKDDYPLVKSFRQREFSLLTPKEKRQFSHVFGPFPGINTRETMKLLKKMFYLSDCQAKKNKTKKACLYFQMGQCLGVCTGDISKTDYQKKVVAPFVSFMNGGKKRLLVTLERRMKQSAKEEQFEEAARLRNQIASLTKIHDIAILNKSFVGEVTKAEGVSRIEGYDISNLGSTGKVASMVVFDSEAPIKSQYRKFKIKNVEGQSDVDCMEEVITRRLRHTEWTYPDLFLIDGGKPQVNRVKEVLRKMRVAIPVVGIAKGPDRKKNEFIFGDKSKNLILWVDKNQELLVRVRDEAHRFAIKFQRSLRRLKK